MSNDHQMPPGIVIRRATPDDAAAIADVSLASYRATYDFPLAHSDQEIRRWIREDVVGRSETWVATDPGAGVVAMLALTEESLDQLYVAPPWQGRGIGGRHVFRA